MLSRFIASSPAKPPILKCHTYDMTLRLRLIATTHRETFEPAILNIETSIETLSKYIDKT